LVLCSTLPLYNKDFFSALGCGGKISAIDAVSTSRWIYKLGSLRFVCGEMAKGGVL
jgi:hypothetical protein